MRWASFVAAAKEIIGVAAADFKTLVTQMPYIDLVHLCAAAVKFAALERQDTKAY